MHPDDVESLRHDTQLVRRAPGTPRQVHVYGFLYDIDRDELELAVDDPPARRTAVGPASATG